MSENLCYSDAYLRQVGAIVVSVEPADGTVVLDRTVFYPGGGGQPSDRATGHLRPETGLPVPSQATRRNLTCAWCSTVSEIARSACPRARSSASGDSASGLARASTMNR